LDAEVVLPAIFQKVPTPFDWILAIVVGIVELIGLGIEIVALFN
jgi:hypothetical protein